MKLRRRQESYASQRQQQQNGHAPRLPVGHNHHLRPALALTGILQQLFNAANAAVPGRFVSSEAMAAVGNNTPIIGLAVTLCVGPSAISGLP